MQKLFFSVFCFFMLLYCQAQTAPGSGIGIVPPQQPQSATFSPVNINAKTGSMNKADRLNVPRQNTSVYIRNQAEQKQKQKEIDLITSEIEKYNRSVRQPNPVKRYVDTSQYGKDLAIFQTALEQLKKLLTYSPFNLSLADAFYVTESAYGDPYLTRKEYDNVLNKSVAFIKTWMQQNKYDLNNNDKHLAIQKFMSEKLAVTESYTSKDGAKKIKQSEHLPFFYDFDDFEGKSDHRNFFVTKCLATGGGQCNSMPMVYLLLPEKLNVPAYLSFAPQHALVKYRKNNGEVVNYEATTNWHINNSWYEENLFISADAIRSGIFLDTFDKQKIVANCMLDLANEYIRKMPNDNGKFIQDCLWESHFYFPKNNNIYAYFIYSSLLKGWLSKYIALHNITDLEKIKQDRWAYDLQKEYQQNEAYIQELGYRDLPEGVYETIVREGRAKNEMQKQIHLSGKKKRNLFSSIQ